MVWFRGSGWRGAGHQKRVSVLTERLVKMIFNDLVLRCCNSKPWAWPVLTSSLAHPKTGKGLLHYSHSDLYTWHRPNYSACWVAHTSTYTPLWRGWQALGLCVCVCACARACVLEKDHSQCDFMVSPALLRAHLLLHTLACTQEIFVTQSLLSSVLLKVLTCKKQKST